MLSCSPVNLFLLLLLSQEEPGFISLITPQDIPPGGTNNFVSAHGQYSPELVRLLRPLARWCWI